MSRRKREAVEALDLVADTRRKCLTVHVLVRALVAEMAEARGVDERVAALVGLVEEGTEAMWEAAGRMTVDAYRGRS